MKTQLFALAFWVLLASQASAMTGAEIIKQQLERHSISSGRCIAQMVLLDKQENRITRTLKLLTRENAGGRDFLAVFIAPEDISGAGLLAKMPPEGRSKLYLYLPAADMVQIISESSSKNYFMGTDFTYEDLQPERVESFEYEILRSEMMDGQLCWVIKAVPADKEQARKSAYSKRLLWITKGHLATLRVEFYDRRDRLVKFLVNKDIMVWRPGTSIMRNTDTGHTTILKLIGQEEINIPLEDSLFTPESLKCKVLCDN